MIIASVIIPTYNYGRFIVQAINSVLDQDYPRELVEIIVVDDGSTDNTLEVLHDFINNHSIQYFYQENRGKANATYAGIQKSRGKYIFTLDADDYFLPGKLKHTIEIFEQNGEIVHVATTYQCLEEGTKSVQIAKLPSDILGKALDGNWILRRFYNDNILFGGGSTYAARANVLKKIVIPDLVDMYIDEFLILALLPFGKSFFIDRPFSIWRIHASNYSGKSLTSKEQIKKEERLIRSSAAVYSYLLENKSDRSLTKIYHLKDMTRRISYKEILRNKKPRDILKYAFEVFFYVRPNWRLIKNYHVINRIVPSPFFRVLKNIASREVTKVRLLSKT